MLVFAALCSLVVAAAAHPVAEPGALPGEWYRSPEEGHPVHKLFARQSTYPAVGSAEWTKKYPPGDLTVAQIPTEWTDALAAAIAAGKIPTNCPVASSSGGYRNSSGTMNPTREPICSSAAQCRGHDQIYDVPDGVVAISFDDGPLPAALPLQQFLRANSQKVTHFYIGGNILRNPKIFMDAFQNSGDDIAVHTWSHPHMTQQTNEMVLAELGWTMQIIHDSTGGRIPRYWRPPYGDSDNRVRAIAKEIFGLQTVIWNDDTDDWNIGTGQTVSGALSILTKAYAGPKSPGLNILEHELSTQTVKVFVDTYPLIKQNGWTAKSIPDAMGVGWYLNAADNTSPVTDRAVAGGASNGTAPVASSSAAASASGTTTATSAGSTGTSAPASGGGGSNGATRLSVAGWALGACAFGAVLLF